MAKDRAVGAALVVGAVIGIIIYGWLMFGFGYGSRVTLYTLEITAFVAVLAILAILGWIGYVMATTPPPMPLEPEPATQPSEGSSPATAQSVAQEKKT